MKPDSDQAPEFDALAAAEELESALGDETSGSGGQNDEYVATLEADIEQLQNIVAQKDALLAKANARADQAYADIAAAERRLATASAKELEQRTRKLVESFLPVVDDLDRAIEAAKGLEHGEAAATGLELVRRELLVRLGQLGVAHAPALGLPFDPVRHDAIALVPVTDPTQDGRVVSVMREGYTIGDDTLRPASVAVGKRNG